MIVPARIVAPIYYPISCEVDVGQPTIGWPGFKNSVLRCRVPIGHGCEVLLYRIAKEPWQVFVDSEDLRSRTRIFSRENYRGGPHYHVDPTSVLDVAPFASVRIIEPAYRKIVGDLDVASYGPPTNRVPYLHLIAQVTMHDGSGSAEVELRFERPDAGRLMLGRGSGLADVTLDFFGSRLRWSVDLLRNGPFHEALSRYTVEGGPDAMWAWWLDVRGVDPARRDIVHVADVEFSPHVWPSIERLERDEPLLWMFFAWLHSSRLDNGVSNNKMLAQMLLRIGANYESLRAEIRRVLDLAPTIQPVQEYGLGESATHPGRPYCMALASM